MENEIENIDSPNDDTTEEVAETTEETTETSDEVDVEALQKQNKKLFERAKRAEGFVEKDGEWIKKPQPKVEKKPEAKNEPHSLLDIRALAKVHDDDVEKVQKFAKSQELSVVDAMKDEDLQAILSNRVEKRRTAEATNTGGSKGFKENQDKELLKKVDQGGEDLSDTDIKRGAELMVEALKTQG